MKTIKQNLMPSLEMFDEGSEVFFDHTDAIDSGTADFAEDNAKIRKDLAATVDVLEGAETDVGSLESLLSALDEAREVGLESWSAYFSIQQVDAVKKRYGVTDMETPMPAMEAFQNNFKRTATSVSMESVREVIAKIFAWMREKMSDCIRMVQHYWNRLIRSLNYVETSATSLRKLAQSKRWQGGDELSLPPTIAARLANGNKVPGSVQELIAGLHRLEVINDVPKETMDVVYRRVTGQLEHIMQNPQSLREIGMPYKEEILVPRGWSEVHLKDADEGERTFVSPRMPGNVEVRISAFGEANQSMTFKGSAGFIRHSPKVVRVDVGDVDTTVKALSSYDVVSLCDAILTVVRKLKDSRRALDQHLVHVRHDIDRIGDKYLQTDGTLPSEIIKKAMTGFYKIAVVYGTELSQACESVAYNALVAHLSYAKHSARVSTQEAPAFPALPAPAA